MLTEKREELLELYDTLIELGVVFYYGSESVQHGEITSIEFKEDESVRIELDDFNELEIELEEFIENHSKEGNNYHTWHKSREFDTLIASLIKE